MNVLTAFAPSLVTAAAIFIVAWLSKGRFDVTDAKIEGLRGEVGGVRGEIAGLRGEMGQVRDDISQIRGELADLRSDITHLALAVGAKTRPETA